MPLVMATSSRSRLADTVEVLDISDEEALKHLIRALKKLAEDRYFKLQEAGVEDIDVLYKSIIDYLVLTNVKFSLKTLRQQPIEEWQLHKLILQEVSTNGEVDAKAIARKLNTQSIEVAVDCLVSSNFLRFTHGGAVVFDTQSLDYSCLKSCDLIGQCWDSYFT